MLDLYAAGALGVLAAVAIVGALVYILGFVLSLPVALVESVRNRVHQPRRSHSGTIAWHS